MSGRLKPPFYVLLISDQNLSTFIEDDYSVAADTAHAFFEMSKGERVLVRVSDKEKEIFCARRGM